MKNFACLEFTRRFVFMSLHGFVFFSNLHIKNYFCILKFNADRYELVV